MPEFDGKHSRQVHWARYNPVARILEIDFKDKNGAKASTYEYAEVSAEVWAAFEAAPSKGSFFAKQIRGRFPTNKKG